tara:strand:+ start:1041 stop:1691 length:651 start_codon:yes stop_codon:yes gene_type:complete
MQHTEIKNAVSRSQHCQRNWDLDKEIPQEDLDLIVHAATQCPSKQNIAYYKLHFITNRNIIEAVHDKTAGFINYETGDSETNSQTLANLLIAFEEEDYIDRHTTDTVFRNDELFAHDNNEMTQEQKDALARDKFMAIGIASGYINLTASMLGYSTGYCACFDGYQRNFKELNAKKPIKLLIGIGFANANKNRLVHHKSDFVFPAKIKQEIRTNFIE